MQLRGPTSHRPGHVRVELRVDVQTTAHSGRPGKALEDPVSCRRAHGPGLLRMAGQPRESITQRAWLVGRNTKSRDLVIDHLRQARHIGADHGDSTRHRLQCGLSEQLGNSRFMTRRCAIHAGDHDTKRAAIRRHEILVRTIVPKRDPLARGQCPEPRGKRRVVRLADDLANHRGIGYEPGEGPLLRPLDMDLQILKLDSSAWRSVFEPIEQAVDKVLENFTGVCG